MIHPPRACTGRYTAQEPSLRDMRGRGYGHLGFNRSCYMGDAELRWVGWVAPVPPVPLTVAPLPTGASGPSSS